MGYETHVIDLSSALGGPVGTGMLREVAQYFKVNEQLSFNPSTQGEHVFLYLQKTGLNTEEVAKKLAMHAKVPRRAVSYAGMKDRHAVTKQWFSVHLPGKEGPDWHLLEEETLRIENITRHSKKLKRGSIKFNEFDIIITRLEGDSDQFLNRAEQIKETGVPNYFMEQRFGYLCQNIERVYRIFSRNEAIKNKKMRNLLLSSARSYLFNQVLNKRVADKNWDKALPGDVFMLNGTRQYFKEERISDLINKRLLEQDIHPTGPLFGVSSHASTKAVYELENQIFKEEKVFCDGLLKAKVGSARRSLRVVPEAFEFGFLSEDALRLKFKLPSGSYATALIRELIKTNRLN